MHQLESCGEWERIRRLPYNHVHAQYLVKQYMDDKVEENGGGGFELPGGGFIRRKIFPALINKHPVLKRRFERFQSAFWEKAAYLRMGANARKDAKDRRALYMMLLMYEHALGKALLSSTALPKELKGMGSALVPGSADSGDEGDASDDDVVEVVDMTAPEPEVIDLADLPDDEEDAGGSGQGDQDGAPRRAQDADDAPPPVRVKVEKNTA